MLKIENLMNTLSEKLVKPNSCSSQKKIASNADMLTEIYDKVLSIQKETKLLNQGS